MRIRTLSAMSCGFVLLALGGCGDRAPLEPDRITEVPAALLSIEETPRGAFTFPCRVSRIDADGPYRYQYGHDSVAFRPSDLADDGATILYTVRTYGPDPQVPVFVAKCIIPRTDKAVKRLDKLFNVDRGIPDGGVVIMCGTPDKPCNVEGVTGSGCQWGGIYPNCNKPLDDIECPALDPYCSGGSPGTGGGTGSDPGGGGSGGDPGDGGDAPDPPDPCDTGYVMIDDPDVQAGFDEIWQASNYGTDVPMSERREKGGWVIMDNVTGEFSFQAWPNDWATSPCLTTVPLPPPNGATAVVHTHPYTRGELLTSCEPMMFPGGISRYLKYTNAPSYDDDAAMRKLRQSYPSLLGMVIDADSIIAYTGAPDEVISTGRCGY